MHKIIKWNLFKRVFWNNPALIWVGNDLIKALNDGFEQKWSKKRLFLEEEQDLFSESMDEIPDFDFGEMETNLENNQTTSINNINLIALQNFRKLKSKAIEFYASKYQILESEIGYIPSNLKADQKISLTKSMLYNDGIKLIVDAHFSYVFIGKNQIYEYVADCFLFDKSAKKMVLLGYSAKSPLDNFYKFFYLINTAKKTHEILDASVIIIDPVINLLRKTTVKEIVFSESFSAHLSKSLPARNNKLTYKENFYKEILARTGDGSLFLESVNYNKAFYSFYKVALRRELPLSVFRIQGLDYLPDDLINYHVNKNSDSFKVTFNLGKTPKFIEFQEINWYYQLIDVAYEKYGENCVYEDISYFVQTDFSDPENTEILQNFVNKNLVITYKYSKDAYLPNLFIQNEEILALLTYIFGIEQWNISKTFFKALKLKYTNFEHIQKATKVSKNLVNFFNIGILEVIKKMHIKNQRIIWYDYEGFSDLFPIINTSRSYEQIVSQVSVIETINGKEVDKINYVVDTKNIQLEDLVVLIDSIYANKADLFIVYNKTYENTRNNEIYNLVEKEVLENPNSPFCKWFEEQNLDLFTFKEMITHINLNTIDLYDCFKYRDLTTKYPQFCGDEHIFSFKVQDGTIVKSKQVKNIDSALKYKSFMFLDKLLLQGSIKKVEKFITYHQIKLKTLIIPYTELVIQKGTMAMNEAILRYHGFTGDNQWNVIENELKKYCENDVRAMIMVYEFIMQAIRSVFPQIDNYEYQIEEQNFQYSIINNKLTITRI
ncbi:DUF2779 domain-containing protein [Mycoplasmopsis citelli]|uniref:UU173 family protein n=1 Tax=Mycoplasmopsis citelli TaxID=171281 RepID=UPI0021143ED8|nr:DUF2779 domain-containing protein [Mycoplasmopsis citelli]UUD35836.1 DUF2779 domain-containing protein [Mycoplasmopsis citelli]